MFSLFFRLCNPKGFEIGITVIWWQNTWTSEFVEDLYYAIRNDLKMFFLYNSSRGKTENLKGMWDISRVRNEIPFI